MRSKLETTIFAGLLICLGLAAPAAQAQAPCTLQSFTGTYAFFERGSSAILDPASEPYPFHWLGSYAPFVTVGEITMGPDGVGQGFYWIRFGSLNGGPDPIPVEVTVTELNEDCTGKFSYLVYLPGFPGPSLIEERFVLMDNGRQFRSIPTVTGIPAAAWVGEGHRIAKFGEPPFQCGPQTAHGSYLMAVENLVRFATTPILSDAVLLRLDVTMTGDVTGMLYEKFGPTGDIELPVWGTLTVDPDCSFASTLYATILGKTAMIPIRGVFFDQGKKLFGLNVNTNPTGTQYSFGEGERIGQ